MKNKKTITLISLIAALAVLLCAWLVLKNYNASNTQEETEETDTSVYIIPASLKEDVMSIDFTTENGAFSFERDEDGVWVYNSDENFPLDQTRPNSMATTLADFKADRLVENGDEESFGFDAPSVTLKATFSDGTELDVVFGNANDFYNGDYYIRDNSNGKVYLIGSSAKISFDVTEKSLLSADTFPTDIKAENITSITVTDETGKDTGTNVITDEEGITALSDLFFDLSFSAERATYTADKGPEGFGLTEDGAKLTVSYKKENSITAEDGTESTAYTDEEYVILFGSSYESDSGSRMYYYSIPNSRLAYSVSSDTYEEIMGYVTYSPAETDAE